MTYILNKLCPITGGKVNGGGRGAMRDILITILERDALGKPITSLHYYTTMVFNDFNSISNSSGV